MALFKRKSKPTEQNDEKKVKAVSGKAGSGSAGKAGKSVEAAPKSRPAKGVSVLASRTIIAPLATEKAAHLADRGVYAFLVAPDANRVAVRQAVRELYHVTPVAVRIIRMRGKAKRFGRFVGSRSDRKKALVTVPSGTHLDLFAAV